MAPSWALGTGARMQFGIAHDGRVWAGTASAVGRCGARFRLTEAELREVVCSVMRSIVPKSIITRRDLAIPLGHSPVGRRDFPDIGQPKPQCHRRTFATAPETPEL